MNISQFRQWIKEKNSWTRQTLMEKLVMMKHSQELDIQFKTGRTAGGIRESNIVNKYKLQVISINAKFPCIGYCYLISNGGQVGSSEATKLLRIGYPLSMECKIAHETDEKLELNIYIF
ncbi:hypothetical protein Anas_08244 [Armadillidium nasatum]|uniref:Uncharacterized protein n=1 Tax=Armadillidium nasatum TaxID=96803 RepID=A0A5N5SVC6_9CRUS|nr:hypothetical protein Anas_08244 [Armadillidium nasatum]